MIYQKESLTKVSMKRPLVHYKSVVSSWMLLLAFVASLAFEAGAQDLVLPPQPAPPPMLYIPEDVRAQLAGARDAKARTRLSLEQAEARLARAEEHTGLKQFNAATAELGVYQAVVEDALQFLRRTGDSDGKTRDLYKRLEQALHRHAARIESVRRTTPGEFSGNVLALVRHVRELRTDTLDAFYGNTILRENRSDQNNSFNPGQKDAPQAPPPSPQPAKPVVDKPSGN